MNVEFGYLSIPKVAIVGRPNVGKSTLFNRLVKSNVAITSHVRGSTRDFKEVTLDVSVSQVRLIDTGGIGGEEGFQKVVSGVSIDLALSCDLILYVVDGQTLPLQEDVLDFRVLNRSVECILVLNKVDSDSIAYNKHEFYLFGSRDVVCVSAIHNRGVSSLFKLIEHSLFSGSKSQFISGECAPFVPSLDEICVSIIGRVNVGKSSLLNALLGRSRAIVSEMAGTTMDPVDDCVTHHGKVIRFIDTAGIRRRGKIEGIEAYAMDRTRSSLARSHVALLILDSSSDFVELDEKISSEALKNNLGLIVVLNKWDIRHKEYKHVLSEFKKRFRFLDHSPVVCVSSLSGRGITALEDLILSTHENFCRRVPTSKLNSIIFDSVKKHPLPSLNGKPLKIYYSVQFDVMPPRIALVMNRPDDLHFSYKRYLVNRIRSQFNFVGVPVLIVAKDKNSRCGEGMEVN